MQCRLFQYCLIIFALFYQYKCLKSLDQYQQEDGQSADESKKKIFYKNEFSLSNHNIKKLCTIE
jgi:hypothetical protein